MVLILLMSCVTCTQLTWSSFCFNGHSRICTHPSRHKMKSRKNNLGERFDIFHGHPSIQRQKEIKEKKQCMPRFDTGITWASIHPSIQGQRKLKKKTIYAKVWYRYHMGIHPSIQEQMKSKKKTIYAKVWYIPAACIHPSGDKRKSRKNNLCQVLIYSICTHPSSDKGKQQRTILCKGLILSIPRVVGWPFSVLFPSAHGIWL